MHHPCLTGVLRAGLELRRVATAASCMTSPPRCSQNLVRRLAKPGHRPPVIVIARFPRSPTDSSFSTGAQRRLVSTNSTPGTTATHLVCGDESGVPTRRPAILRPTAFLRRAAVLRGTNARSSLRDESISIRSDLMPHEPRTMDRAPFCTSSVNTPHTPHHSRTSRRGTFPTFGTIPTHRPATPVSWRLLWLPPRIAVGICR